MSKSRSRYVGKGQFATLLTTFLVASVLSGILLAGIVVPAAGAAGIMVKSGPKVFDSLPAEFEILPPSEQSTLLAADGSVLARFYSENRIIVPLDEISPHLQEAIVAIEDRRFYEHEGIDPDGMVRAAVNNLSSDSTQGASTITQQYVKNTLLEAGLQRGDQDLIDAATEQTVARKLREARYALALENKMSKDEILTGYLNIAPFGTNVYGAESSSRLYFSKSAKDLTVPEAALMAGIVKSPTQYDPLYHPEAAKNRRDTVLAAMLAQEMITQEEFDQATALEIEDMLKPDYTPQGCAGAGNAAHFCEYTRQYLLASDKFGKDESERKQKLLRGGITIKTTLNPAMQKAAFEEATNAIPVNDPSGANTALVTREVKTGKILAMAQNTNFGIPTEADPSATQTNFNVSKAMGGGDGFSAGSTLKPFTMLQWFREGHTVWERVGGHPRQFLAHEWNIPCAPEHAADWPVGDVGGKAGTFNVIDATAQSVNRAYAEMATHLNMCEIFDGMAALGIGKPDGTPYDPKPAEIIGAPATPLALAGAYSALANQGVLCEPMPVTEVLDRNDKPIVTYEPVCNQAVPAKEANQVAAVLQRVASGPFYSGTNIGRPHIAKTGTASQNSNLWVAGATPQVATVGWAGYARASSKSLNGIYANGVQYGYVYGGTLTGPMWRSYMARITEGMEYAGFAPADLGTPPPPPAPAQTEDGDGQGNQGNGQGNGRGGEEEDD
ncbi:MAG: transglycosylase domain-containing protein [Actinomycetaceae bacterium]|nr:transglycosylase domain-containing protein [Actinomycetaceae bacterium]